MEITVSARQAEVSSALRSAVDEKIGRLSRYLEGMDRAEVHFSEERNPRIADKEVCEVTLEGHGTTSGARWPRPPTAFAAVDIADGQARAPAPQAEDRCCSGATRGRARPSSTPARPCPPGCRAPRSDGSGPEPRIVKTKSTPSSR